MKFKSAMAIASFMSLIATTGTFAEEFTKGKVKKVNAEKGKVSVAHEELKNLEMPAMTMVFRTSTPEMLKKEGISFAQACQNEQYDRQEIKQVLLLAMPVMKPRDQTQKEEEHVKDVFPFRYPGHRLHMHRV